MKAWYALTFRCPQLKVYVGGISWNIDDKALLDAFSPFGQCEAHIMVDKYTGRSRGFGFVTFQVSLQKPKGETCSDLESFNKYAHTCLTSMHILVLHTPFVYCLRMIHMRVNTRDYCMRA